MKQRTIEAIKNDIGVLDHLLGSSVFAQFRTYCENLEDEQVSLVLAPPSNDGLGALLLREQLIGEARQTRELVHWFEGRRQELQQELQAHDAYEPTN